MTDWSTMRQQLLFLSLASPDLASNVVAWSRFDGTGGTVSMAGDSEQPPYQSVLAAMKDGWRVIQVPQLVRAPSGQEHQTAFLPFEYVLERLVEPAPNRTGGASASRAGG